MAARAIERLLTATLLALAGCTHAQEREAPLDVVSFEAQASREVANDQLVAVLAVELHGPDPAALPFTSAAPTQDTDRGLDEDIIRPHLLEDRVKTHQAVATGTALDVMCLTDDGS